MDAGDDGTLAEGCGDERLMFPFGASFAGSPWTIVFASIPFCSRSFLRSASFFANSLRDCEEKPGNASSIDRQKAYLGFMPFQTPHTVI